MAVRSLKLISTFILHSSSVVGPFIFHYLMEDEWRMNGRTMEDEWRMEAETGLLRAGKDAQACVRNLVKGMI
jgi:hypothetical protein